MKKSPKAIVSKGKLSGKIRKTKSTQYKNCYDYFIQANSVTSKSK